MFCEYARRESNPQLFLRRELLCPFNYGHINNIMKNNVRIVGERLRKGEYMMEAIRKAEKIIYESRKDDGI